MREKLTTAGEIVGIGLISVGLGMFAAPLGLIAAGFGLFATCFVAGDAE